MTFPAPGGAPGTAASRATSPDRAGSASPGRYAAPGSGRGESGTPVPAADHQRFMSAFPTGVAVVTAIGRDGPPHGMTCTSLSSVTLEPPTLLVCLTHGSGTLDAVRSRGGFAVNLLRAGAREVAELFSSARGGRFSRVRWQGSPTWGAPWLAEDAFAVAECEVAQIASMGDHDVVFGRVRWVQLAHGIPLLYGLRTFSRWMPPLTPHVQAD
jgi:flavin reductase (NADH)